MSRRHEVRPGRKGGFGDLKGDKQSAEKKNKERGAARGTLSAALLHVHLIPVCLCGAFAGR